MIALAACGSAGHARESATAKVAASSQPAYGPAPQWAAPPPAASDTPTPEGSPYRVVYSDNQLRFGETGTQAVSSFRVRLLSPQALALGSLSLSWNPASQNVTVNDVKIHRGSEVIDVLKTARFATIQREANLEAAMLTGILTATLQVPGLQVGDELEFRTTLNDRDVAFGNHLFGAAIMPLAEGPGVNRIVADESADRHVRFAASPDLKPHAAAGAHAALWEWRDPPKVEPVEGAPPRFNLFRFVEYSDFADWAAVSRAVYPVFDGAAVVPRESPLQAEIARIATASSDPVARAEAALKLVQESVRYVYVGLDGGNYRPVSAEETWRNRFGDCKGKSALLVALLRGLGIEADYVLVNSGGGDGLDQRLPGPHVFDHVLVRATIAGKTYFLDGTQYGDRALALLEQPPYRFVLPLSREGATLTALPAQPLRRPGLIRTISVDASDGAARAKVTQVNYILGGEGAKLRASLAALSPEQADRGLRAFWSSQESWIEPEHVEWRYDESRSAAILTVRGTAEADWGGNAREGRFTTVPRSGFYPPTELKRPAAQDQAVPYLTDFPSYICSVVNMRLPAPGGRYAWTIEGQPFDTTVGGERYVRRAAIASGVLSSIRISQTFLPEVTADQAKAINAAIPKFDNSTMTVIEAYPRKAAAAAPVPLIDAVDWTGLSTPCSLTAPSS